MRSRANQNLLRLETSSEAPLPFSHRALELFLLSILKALKIRESQISLSFVKDGTMRRLHEKWMGRRITSDCLSLEYSRKKLIREPLGFVGDIVVCLDEARRRSKELKVSYAEETGRYLVHGILHCLGHDDRTAQKRSHMWRLQEKLLNRFKKILTPTT
jgi:probable rRNA maturation factor